MSQIFVDVMFTLLTILMGAIDLIPSIAYAMQSMMSKTVGIFGAKVARRNFLDWIYIAIWVTVGILSLYLSRPASILTLFIFFTFKSGSDLGARAIYAIHDAVLLRRKSSKIIATAIILASIPSVIFIMIWEIFQQLFTSVSASILGISMSRFPYYLWIAGILFGATFGIIRSGRENGILLRGELFLVMGSLIARQ